MSAFAVVPQKLAQKVVYAHLRLVKLILELIHLRLRVVDHGLRRVDGFDQVLTGETEATQLAWIFFCKSCNTGFICKTLYMLKVKNHWHIKHKDKMLTEIKQWFQILHIDKCSFHKPSSLRLLQHTSQHSSPYSLSHPWTDHRTTESQLKKTPISTLISFINLRTTKKLTKWGILWQMWLHIIYILS